MRIIPSLFSLLLALSLSPLPAFGRSTAQQTRQLAAVRGEITKMKSASKGMLLITVKPAKDFAEVTVLARENDLVGQGVGRAQDSDLLGLLSDDSRDEEAITAAELSEGDVVSVIYDPRSENRVLEIYAH